MTRIHTLLQSARIRYSCKLQKLTKLLTKYKKFTTLLHKCYRSSRIQNHVLWSGSSRGPMSMSVPNLKRIALFVQKLLGGSQNFEIWSRDLGHAHLGVVLWSGHHVTQSSSWNHNPNHSSPHSPPVIITSFPKFRRANN